MLFAGTLAARLAIVKGNKFIWVFFLIIVIGTILRFAYDVSSGIRLHKKL